MPELSARYLGKNADRAGVVAMRRIRTSSEKIRAELTWVNQPLDPNKCSCRHMRCCEETNHSLASVQDRSKHKSGPTALSIFVCRAGSTSAAVGRCLAQDSTRVNKWSVSHPTSSNSSRKPSPNTRWSQGGPREASRCDPCDG